MNTKKFRVVECNHVPPHALSQVRLDERSSPALRWPLDCPLAWESAVGLEERYCAWGDAAWRRTRVPAISTSEERRAGPRRTQSNFISGRCFTSRKNKNKNARARVCVCERETRRVRKEKRERRSKRETGAISDDQEVSGFRERAYSARPDSNTIAPAARGSSAEKLSPRRALRRPGGHMPPALVDQPWWWWC